MCYLKAITLGWDAKRFAKHFESFVMRVKYPTFTVAEFFGEMVETKLRPYDEYVKATQESGGSINNSIHKFYFLNANRSGLTMYWIDMKAVSEYQLEILRQQEAQDRLELKRIKTDEEIERATRLPQLPPANPPKKPLEDVVNELLRELEEYNRLIMAYSDNPAILLDRAAKIKERVLEYKPNRMEEYVRRIDMMEVANGN